MCIRILSQWTGIVLGISLSIGCATTDDLRAAQEEARRATAAANEAKAIAQSALDAANEAQATAADARSISLSTEEKLNRMFKRSMFK